MKRKWGLFLYPLAAFLLPMVITIIAFGLHGIAPLGSKNILVSDLATQYLPFFNFMRTQLVQHTYSAYSLLLSLGDNTLPVYTYYLMSPLNWLVRFVPETAVPLLMEAIIIIKIGLISLSMQLFLQVRSKQANLMQLLAGLSYGLCGFVSMYFYDFMWLDALILLPLLTWSLDRLFYRGKWGSYLLILALTIVVNYYMGYMLCLYSVIYFVYLILLNQRPETGFFQFFKQHRRLVCKYLGASLLAASLAAFLLVPTVIGMLATGKSSLNPVSFLPIPRFLPSVFTALGVGATNFASRLNHEPALFVGSLFTLGLWLYWLSPLITRQRKRASFWLVGAIFFGMLISTFDTMWHMFQMPAGFPFREVYMLSFVVILLGYDAWQAGAFYDRSSLIKAITLTISLLLAGYLTAYLEKIIVRVTNWKFTYVGANHWHLLVALLLIIFIGMLLWYQASHRASFLVKLALLFGVSLELGTNFSMALGGTDEYGEQHRFATAFQQSKKIIDRHTGHQKDFGRTNLDNRLYKASFNINYNQYNDALLFNFFGVNSYTSSMNKNTHDALAQLGLYSRNERRISVNGVTPVTEQLLRLDQRLVIEQDGSYRVHHDARNRGLGYAVSEQINTYHPVSNQVFTNLNQLVQKEQGRTNNYFLANQIELAQVQKQAGIYRYTVKTTPRITGKQYLAIPTSSPNQPLAVKVNGRRLKTSEHQLGAEIIPVGKFAKGQTYTIQFNSSTKLANLQNNLVGFDDAGFDRYVTATNPYRLKISHPERLKLKGHDFKGTIKTTTKRPVVLISLPYDRGWQLTDGGKPVKIKKTVGGLMSVHLTPGNHVLHFKYQTPGLRLGMLISALGLVATAGFWWWFKDQNKRGVD
ncbi:integral membrane protein [Fructilactobacillus florum 8D]|uniref:Integral membrane protein n=1 Tax=Fructilactobacillus florum 8D TaxID=1221538 RepID=W9ELU6_9LACO|nr:YfhO family protein [Fructilactobacillus florum]ETO40659.1 integral membrane protein [Fructilactobacillus florum 8D]